MQTTISMKKLETENNLTQPIFKLEYSACTCLSLNTVETKQSRKRKERHSSKKLYFDKTIRSNSEERINNKKLTKCIRKVSSHEDLQKVKAESKNATEESNNKNTKKCEEVEIFGDECVRKRHRERYFQLNVHKKKACFRSKSPKPKQLNDKGKSYQSSYQERIKEEKLIKTKPLNEISQMHLLGNDDTISPYHSPSSSILDLSALHKQIDCSEPVPSNAREITENTEAMPSASVACNKQLQSPRNSIIATERIYLNQYVAQTNTPIKLPLSPLEKQLNHLSKQIKQIKKQIKSFEIEFEKDNGRKPTDADKLKDTFISALISNLLKLKKDYKSVKRQERLETVTIVKPLREVVEEIEKKLQSKRLLAGRVMAVGDMSNSELIEEKVMIQKELLNLQSMFGRPNNKEDKDLVRPLYDRYRNLKRAISRTSSIIKNENELETILENETLDLASEPKDVVKQENVAILSENVEDDSSFEKSLQDLSLEKLLEEQLKAFDEKKQLRDTIKLFENTFQLEMGRKMKKEDREPIRNVFESYKKVKAKLKLINVLLEKQ